MARVHWNNSKTFHGKERFSKTGIENCTVYFDHILNTERLGYKIQDAVVSTVIDPFQQRSNRGIILNSVFNNSAQEAISTFSTHSG